MLFHEMVLMLCNLKTAHSAVLKWVVSGAASLCLLGLFIFASAISVQAQNDDVSNDVKIETLQQQLDSLPLENLNERAKVSLFLIYAYEEAGQTELAREKSKKLEAFIVPVVSEKVQAYSLYRVLAAYTKEGNYEKAFKILENYRETATPETRSVRRYSTIRALAEIYESLGYYERSAAIIEEALVTEEFQDIETFQQDRLANHLLLANQYNKLGKPQSALDSAKAAREHLDIIIAARPDANKHVLSNLRMKITRAEIESYIDLGQDEFALEKLDDFLERAEKYDRRADRMAAFSSQARIYIREGQFAKAAPLLREVIDRQSEDVPSNETVATFLNYAAVLEAMGEDQAALSYYKNAEATRRNLEHQRIGLRSSFVAAEIENAARSDRLKELEMEKAVASASARRSNFIAMLSLIAAAFALSAMAGFYRSWRTQKSARLKLQTYARELKLSEALANEHAIKAEAASEAKTAFLANMSHEIRTPMNGVLGMAQVLKGSGLNANQEEFVSIIETSSQALLTIINDILDFSKIEAGKLDLDPIAACLRQSVEDVTTMLSPSAEAKNVDLLVRFAPDTPVNITADIGRVRQILINLVSNAIKFTKTGYVLINISGHEQDGMAQLKFEVLDTGIGIPEEKLAAIFEEFNQAENSTTRQFGGTGLGLSISKRLIEAMGGTLSVVSKYGKGSIFQFSLTFPCHTNLGQTPPCSEALKGKRALLVSGLPLNQKILAEELAGWGIESNACATGQSAFKDFKAAQLGGAPYDYILLDDKIEDISAAEFTDFIRKTGTSKESRIIVLTTTSAGSRALQNVDFSADSVIMKPQKQSSLFMALQAHRPLAISASYSAERAIL